MKQVVSRPPVAVFLGVLLISLALLPPANYGVDGESMLAVSRSLAFDHSFAIACGGLGAAGRGGSCYSIWYPLLSIVMIPFVAAGRLLAGAAGIPNAAGEEAVALLVPALATAGAAALTADLARSMGASTRAAVLAAAAFAFATEVLAYTRTLFAETLGAFFVALTVWGFTGDARRRRLVGLPAIALVVLTKPQLLLVGPAIGLAATLSRRSARPIAEALAAALVGGVVFLGYNLLRFGDPTQFGGPARQIAGVADRGPVSSVVYNAGLLTISPNHGLFVYSPVAVIGVLMLWRHRRNPVVLACAGGALGVFALYLLQPFANSWGTRYLVPALPLICAPLALAQGRPARVAVALAVVGLVIQLPTTVAYYQRYARDNGPISQRSWTLSGSQLWRIWPTAYREIRDASRTDPATFLAGNTVGKADNTLFETVALWFWVLPVAGIPWEAGLVVALLLLAAGIAVLVRAARGPPATALAEGT